MCRCTAWLRTQLPREHSMIVACMYSRNWLLRLRVSRPPWDAISGRAVNQRLMLSQRVVGADDDDEEKKRRRKRNPRVFPSCSTERKKIEFTVDANIPCPFRVWREVPSLTMHSRSHSRQEAHASTPCLPHHGMCRYEVLRMYGVLRTP